METHKINAPPPAPSCPTEQGELVQELERYSAFRWNAGDFQVCELFQRAIKALSRQPAPSADASSQSGEGGSFEPTVFTESGRERVALALAEARIAELEAEVARLKGNELQYLHTIELWRMNQTNDEHAQLRAAPSAVAKDRAEVIRETAYNLFGAGYNRTGPELMQMLQTFADSLLSQPAVAQTEAGNKGTL